MGGGHLPAEVLEKLFGFLCKEDLVSCSGVNIQWYGSAKRRLARKYGIKLCRKFERVSSKSRDVCLAGDQAVQNFSKRRLRKLQALRVQYDEPGTLRTSVDTIFASCKNLKHLELLNLAYISDNDVNVILEHCNPGLKLRVSLRDRGKSKEALAALEEHRELFQEILVECDLNCIEGWFPIPVGNSKFIIPDMTREVSLECLGLKDIECSNSNSLKTIKLEKCYALSEASLYTLSRLNITTLSIGGCSARESTWLDCFRIGFRNLKSISITGCDHLTPSVIQILGTKNLINIKLELNKTVETSGLPHLRKSSELESLHIITDQIITNNIREGVEKHWPNLRRLQVEESLFSYDETLGNIDALARLSQLKQIEFIYCSNPFKIMETSRFKSQFQN